MLNKIALHILAAVTLSGCALNGSYEISEESKTKTLVERSKTMPAKQSYVYARPISNSEVLSKKTVRVSTSEPHSLLYILETALPNYHIVPGDVDVDLSQTLTVSLDSISVSEFVEYLEGATGYEIEVQPGRIDVRSFIHMDWALEDFANSKKFTATAITKSGAGLSMDSEGGSSEGGGEESSEDRSRTLLETSRGSGDDWSALEQAGHKMLGLEKEDKGNGNQNGRPTIQTASNPFSDALRSSGGRDLDIRKLGDDVQQVQFRERFAPKPYLASNRLTGIIRAGGPAHKIRALDAFYKRLQEKADQTINVQFYVYEVTIKEGKQKSINWSAINTSNPGGDSLISTFARNIVPASNQLFNFGASYQGDDFSAETFVNFLETQGEVEVVASPNTTANHGSPVTFKTGESIPVVLEVSSIVSSDGLGQGGGKIQQMEVGVNVSTTSWVKDDGRIIVDVMPSLSSVSGNEVIQIGDAVLPVPRISFTDLSTRVTVDPGRPIILGGLTKSTMATSFDGVPVKNKAMKGVLKVPFGSVDNSLERTELVIVVKPTVVDGEY